MLVKATTAAAASTSSLLSKHGSVAIIGAGIGGLTTANALLYDKPQLVDRVTVYERANEFAPTAGAGFGFSPNGQVCLSSIGIDRYQSMGHPFSLIARLNPAGTEIEYESMALRDLREKIGFGLGGFFRADIIDLLLENLESKNTNNKVQYGHCLTNIVPRHEKVELQFANGHQDVVDLVVGADGIHSKVASQLNIDDSVPPIYSGANIFYGKIPVTEETSDFFEKYKSFFSDGTVLNGPGTGEFMTFYVGAGDKKTLIWVNTYSSSKGPPPKREEWDAADHMEELDEVLKEFPSTHLIHELASMTTTHAADNNSLLHFGLYCRQYKSTWTNGRVVLLGDSCHATLPYVGQGANQAIEDAIVLADCLYKHDDYEAAYQEYYQRRFTRTKRIVQVAGIMDKLYHSKNPLAKMGQEFLTKQLATGGFVFQQLIKEVVDECPVQDFQRFIPT